MSEIIENMRTEDLEQGSGKFVFNRKNRVWFANGAIIDNVASEKGGHLPDSDPDRPGEFAVPIYRDTVMFMAKDPDSKDCACREATEVDKRRYPAEWAYFEKVRHKTPIGHLPGATQAIVETAHAIKIGWVDQMAEADPASLPESLQRFVLLAKQYLLIASGGKPRVRLEAAA